MLEVAQAVRDEEDNSGSAHSNNDAQSDSAEHSASVRTPTPPIVSPQHVVSGERTPSVTASLDTSVSAQGTSPQSTDPQGTASEDSQVPTPNDYTSTGGLQTPGGDEGIKGTESTSDLAKELEKMKHTVNAQAAEIKKLRKKFRRLKKFVWPLVQNFRLYVKEKKQSQKPKSKSSKKSSKSKKKHKRSSFTKLGRNQDKNLDKDDAEVKYSKDAHLWQYPESPKIFEPESYVEEDMNIAQEEKENEQKNDEQEKVKQDVDAQNIVTKTPHKN